MQGRSVAALTGLALAVGTANSLAFARDAGESLTVCLAVSPVVPISVPQKTAILGEANAIWQPHSVAVREGWDDESCDRLIAVKSDAEARPEDASQPTALAWVPFVEGRARRVVFLRVSRAKALIDGVSPGTRPEGLTDLLAGRLIGRSLAHELGHVLLDTKEHDTTGLMRARYRAQDVLRDSPAAYTLDARQRTRLFANRASDILFVRR
jgi:hypothetical protein